MWLKTTNLAKNHQNFLKKIKNWWFLVLVVLSHKFLVLDSIGVKKSQLTPKCPYTKTAKNHQLFILFFSFFQILIAKISL